MADTTTTTSAATATTAKDSATIIGDRALVAFASTPTSGDTANNTVNATWLSGQLADPSKASGLFVLDIRKKADYDKGHIDGATNIEFANWATPDNLKMLPKDKKIVVVCYTGNTAALTASGMRMLGFNAIVLKEGMNGWTKSTASDAVIADLNAANKPVTMTPAGASAAGAAGNRLQHAVRLRLHGSG